MNTSINDPYNLQRFVEAQDSCFEGVCSELRAGQKRSHWMWFIFPQWKGLGSSSLAMRYAISSRQEGVAYLGHSILGARLVHCTDLVVSVEGRSIEQILGSPDDLKFRSSMTLFANLSPDNVVFKDALQKYYAGEPDRVTLQLL